MSSVVVITLLIANFHFIQNAFFNHFPFNSLTNYILHSVGRKYLQEVIGPVIHRIVIAERKVSLEVDPR